MSEYITYNVPKTGYDDSFVWSIHEGHWTRATVAQWMKTFLISVIPFPGVGSVQPHVMIPLIFYLYLRNFTVIAFLILLWIIVEFFVYSLFGVWDFGAYFGLHYRAIWKRRLRGEEETEEEEEEKEKERKREKDTEDEETPYEEEHHHRHGLGVSVMNSIRKRGLNDKTEQIALLLDDVGYTMAPDDPDPVGVIITNLLYNVVFALVGVLFAMYAVRAYNLDTFRFDSNFSWVLAIQMVIVFFPMALHGAIISWLSSLFVLVLIWGAFAPWNTSGYSDFSTHVASPYIFWSVIIVYFTIVFSRVFVWWGDWKLYPWPTDRRYFINAAFGLGFAFWLTSLIFTIVDAD